MLTKRTIFEIHQLINAGYSQRKIAGQLGLSRHSVKKYLETPEAGFAGRMAQTTKLAAFKNQIESYLKQDPDISAVVIHHQIKSSGYTGELTTLRNYLRTIRGTVKSRQTFIRFESGPGEQFQIDWGVFGTITYGNTKRKLQGLAVIESYSRMLFVFFTHSQKQAVLHQGLLQAFQFFKGTPREIVTDNMLTAVTERAGGLIRYNEAFLEFLRPFGIKPRACNIRSPHEKGKIEKSIGYLKKSFLPLKSFQSLEDAEEQVHKWLNTVANVRIHQTTGLIPQVRFKETVGALKPLPVSLPDTRETISAMVHKDFAIRFDGNAYTTPPWAVGKKVTIKASQQTLSVYYHQNKIADHPRCWDKRQRIEIPAHLEQLKKVRKKLWEDRNILCLLSKGEIFADYINALGQQRLPIKQTVLKLLQLVDQYGKASLEIAIQKAIRHKAFGAEYIENILYQEMTPQNHHPPVRLKQENLNQLRLPEPNLSEYDAIALKRRNNP